MQQLRTPHSEQSLVAGQLRYFILEIVIAFAKALAHLVTSEAANGDLLASLGNFFSDHLAHGLRRLFDKRLIEQDELFIEFIESALNDFVDYLIRFVGVLRIVLRLL